jgi:hypothetical protein
MSTTYKICVNNIENACLYVDNTLCGTTDECCWQIDVANKLLVRITYQSGIPVLRVNNFLVNFWLADVVVLPNAIEFWLDQNFFNNYNKKDKQGRLMSLNDVSEHVLDRNVGRCYNESLVNKLKQMLDEKRNIF